MPLIILAVQEAFFLLLTWGALKQTPHRICKKAKQKKKSLQSESTNMCCQLSLICKMLKIIFVGANSTVSSDGINTHTNWSGFLLLIYDSWSLPLTRIPNICYNDKIHIKNTDKLAEIYTWQEDNWHFIRFTCSGIPDKPRFWEKTLTNF